VIYLVIVLGLATPRQPGRPAGLALSMLAAAVAAIGYVARPGAADRLGHPGGVRRRQAPDEVLPPSAVG